MVAFTKSKLSSRAKFALGSMVMTRSVAAMIEGGELGHDEVLLMLSRHVRGDWGDVCAADAKENELSLRRGFRLLSSYASRGGVKLWVIAEADRSATTVLLPSDY